MTLKKDNVLSYITKSFLYDSVQRSHQRREYALKLSIKLAKTKEKNEDEKLLKTQIIERILGLNLSHF